MKYKIAIIDDHFAVRDGYQSFLQNFEFVNQVDTYENSEDFFKSLKTQNYNLALIDIQLKGENGLDICKNLKLINQEIRVLMLSTFHSQEYIISSYENKADGYLFKDSDSSVVKFAIEEVLVHKRKYFENEALRVIFDHKENFNDEPTNKIRLLTELEIKIITLICEGKSNKEIAVFLNRKVSTIGTHKQNIMKKIESHKTVDIYRYATKNGIYSPLVDNSIPENDK